jgi:hypothetical protein
VKVIAILLMMKAVAVQGLDALGDLEKNAARSQSSPELRALGALRPNTRRIILPRRIQSRRRFLDEATRRLERNLVRRQVNHLARMIRDAIRDHAPAA